MATKTQRVRVGRLAALAGLGVGLGVGVGAVLGSCGQNARAGRSGDSNEPVTAGLAAMERGDSPTPRATTPDPYAAPEPGTVDALARQSAIDLERALASSPSGGGTNRAAEVSSGSGGAAEVSGHERGVSVGLVSVERSAGAGTDASASSDVGAGVGAGADASGPEVSAGLASMGESGSGTAASGGQGTLDERIREASAELSRMYVERAASSATPAADLAVASALAASVGEAAPSGGNLSASERATLGAVHTLVGSLKGGGSESGSVVDAADALQKSADEASAGLPLRITDARLCTRVTGFGDYVELGVNAFLAGRPSPVIVYTQVDRFGSRASAGGRQTVELSQELNIYHDADGAHCWKRPAQTISESTRTRRRDFYLTNAIELPPTLTIGKYRLKVTMRDVAGGSVAETTIPFSIVADPGLAHTAE